jgi:hypothetical protein
MGRQFEAKNDSPARTWKGANLGSIAARGIARAAKGYLRNLLLYDSPAGEFRDTMDFWFRPAPVGEGIRVNWEKMQPVGMSHGYASYNGTDNVPINLEIYQNAAMILKETVAQGPHIRGTAEGGGTDMGAIAMMMEDDRRFLEALGYPGAGPSGAIEVAAPCAILCLPGLLTLRVRLVSLDFTFEDCDGQGRLKEWRAAAAFEEAPMGRITMQDHLTNGMFRTWGV